MRSWMTAGILAVLASGVTAAPIDHYVDAAAAEIKRSLRDPYDLREVARTDLFTIDTNAWHGKSVMCVRFNGKNANGAYIGVDTYHVIFFPNEEVAFVAASNPCAGQSHWVPFPELGRPD